MKIELNVSTANEGTRAPYWLILAPKPMRGLDVCRVAEMTS